MLVVDTGAGTHFDTALAFGLFGTMSGDSGNVVRARSPAINRGSRTFPSHLPAELSALEIKGWPRQSGLERLYGNGKCRPHILALEQRQCDVEQCAVGRRHASVGPDSQQCLVRNMCASGSIG